eukprot:COSAG01_NODE_4187_length_5258_cov_294.487691_2_plen_122_part_00
MRCRYLWSHDGLRWERTTAPVEWCNITYTDGSREMLSRRERPKWIMDPVQGYPLGLLSVSVPFRSLVWRRLTEIPLCHGCQEIFRMETAHQGVFPSTSHGGQSFTMATQIDHFTGGATSEL